MTISTPVRQVVPLDELLAGATDREPLVRADGLSNVPMERLVLDGQRCVLKHTSTELDWVMRMANDTVCRAAKVWELGLLDTIAPHVDSLVLGIGYDDAAASWGVLMRDASGEFLEEGAAPIPVDRQAGFLRDMAGMHAALWGFEHVPGLCRPSDIYGLFSPASLAREAERGPLTGVPSFVDAGRAELERALPEMADDLRLLVVEHDRIVRALAETPQTFVHHDWKGGNLGTRADGRTVLVDWAFPGSSAGLADIAWYLACNCDRLLTSKEQVIEDYRTELELAGITTAGWFERQLDLALLGAFVILGWSKVGDPAELHWWVDRTAHVAAELAR